MNKLKQYLKRMRMYLAYRLLMNTGMVMVNTEDWKTTLDTSAALALYVQTSGHINNGRNKSRKRLRTFASRLLVAQTRFVHPSTVDQMKPSPQLSELITSVSDALGAQP